MFHLLLCKLNFAKTKIFPPKIPVSFRCNQSSAASRMLIPHTFSLFFAHLCICLLSHSLFPIMAFFSLYVVRRQASLLANGLPFECCFYCCTVTDHWPETRMAPEESPLIHFLMMLIERVIFCLSGTVRHPHI